MAYEVRYSKRAERQLRRLDRRAQQLVRTGASQLGQDPRPRGAKKLRGELEGYYSVRVGIHYRVVYTVDDKVRIVEIVSVGSREEIY